MVINSSAGYPPGHFDQAAPVATTAAPLAGQPVLPLPPGGQPANFAPPFLVPPPQFLPPPQTAPPNLINYVQGPSGPPFPPNFQGYQGFTPPVQVRWTYLRLLIEDRLLISFLSFRLASGTAAAAGTVPTAGLHLLQSCSTTAACSSYEKTKSSDSDSTAA